MLGFEEVVDGVFLMHGVGWVDMSSETYLKGER